MTPEEMTKEFEKGVERERERAKGAEKEIKRLKELFKDNWR